MRAFCWLVLPLALTATTAQAQPEDADRIFCLSHSPHWDATAADIGAIEIEPVPSSFRIWSERVQTCPRLWDVGSTLIGWHLRFGSERSMAAALDYLEQQEMQDLPSPEDYARTLAAARRAALPDMRGAPASDHSARYRFFQSRRSLRRLGLLAEGQRRFLFMAQFAPGMAEEFDSLPLLVHAERYLRAADLYRRA